jgi:hypothetical protein
MKRPKISNVFNSWNTGTGFRTFQNNKTHLLLVLLGNVVKLDFQKYVDYDKYYNKQQYWNTVLYYGKKMSENDILRVQIMHLLKQEV